MNIQPYNLRQLFEKIAKDNPNNIALSYCEKNKNVTYKTLNESANQLANFLLEQNINKNDVIALVNTKESMSFALMLACLKIGATYTNIDEDNPTSRTIKIIETCQPKLLFADHDLQTDLQHCLHEIKLPLINLKEKSFNLYAKNNIDMYPQIDGTVAAYIMFTSGSTGTPKGVVISHQSLLNFIQWSVQRYAIKTTDVFANVSPIYFDNSVFDFYTSLFSGATLAPIAKSVTKNALELVRTIDDLACTIWFSVPSLLIYLNTFKVLTAERFSKIRVITFGGEGFPKPVLKSIFDRYQHRISFVNVYGPTEGTCICSSYSVTAADFKDLSGILPLGHINPNFDFKIINELEQPQTKGEQGELCLLGPNLALGYFNDKLKTEQAFVANSQQPCFFEKMYKTGDIVYQDKKDNLLYFVARKDNQIKHMGYRIELDEIDQACQLLPYVVQAVAVYKRVNINFGKIFAYLIAKDGFCDQLQVIKDLSHALPDYMLPAEIIFIDELPKNANGKVDRKRLQLMDDSVIKVK
jgi:D-alanine--poly(phosphoribitol) ligase subunit 1